MWYMLVSMCLKVFKCHFFRFLLFWKRDRRHVPSVVINFSSKKIGQVCFKSPFESHILSVVLKAGARDFPARAKASHFGDLVLDKEANMYFKAFKTIQKK